MKFTKDQIKSLQKYLNRSKQHNVATGADFPEFKGGDFNWFQRLLRLDRNNTQVKKVEILGTWVKYTFYYKAVDETMFVFKVSTFHYD